MSCNGCKDGPPIYTHTLMVQKPNPAAVGESDGQVDLADDANWTNVGRIRARFITRDNEVGSFSGSENEVHMQPQATRNAVIKAAPNIIAKTLDPSWRLRMGTRKFNIISSGSVNESPRAEVRIEVIERKQVV